MSPKSQALIKSRSGLKILNLNRLLLFGKNRNCRKSKRHWISFDRISLHCSMLRRYKNFTAIDTHTVHEKEIIQLRLNDTNGIENFVKNFAKAYYSWDTSKEAIEARTTEISKYLTKELQDLNADTIRTDIPNSATVTNVLVWNVKQSGTDDFTVAYEVDQQVKEGEQTQAVIENYTVMVHVDKGGAMVITQNPTLVLHKDDNWKIVE